MRAEGEAARRDLQFGGVVEGLPRTAPIPESLFRVAKSRIRGTHQLTVAVDLADQQTGETTRKFLTLASDRQLSPEEAEERAAILAERYGLSATSASIVSGVRAGALGSRSLREKFTGLEALFRRNPFN